MSRASKRLSLAFNSAFSLRSRSISSSLDSFFLFFFFLVGLLEEVAFSMLDLSLYPDSVFDLDSSSETSISLGFGKDVLRFFFSVFVCFFPFFRFFPRSTSSRKNAATRRPPRSAAVCPRVFLASASAPAFTRRSTTPKELPLHACIRGVFPSRSRASKAAPTSRRNSTTLSAPRSHAYISGVMPRLSTAWASALQPSTSTRIVEIFGERMLHAASKTVPSSYSLIFCSTLAFPVDARNFSTST
mmetsp:Transcript_3198/g.6283  ORF Transcript_3198/g.6283 Transcript_3198/m.6283 type:complete len:244 (-) Transcript_3198:267-998(-)